MNRRKRFFQIEHNDETISFVRRSLGESGRDILAVKAALGTIVPATEIGPDAESLVGESGWFDCDSGGPLSPADGAVFDKKMQKALMNFQLENQFFIMEYLFRKYSISTLLEQTIPRDDDGEVIDRSLGGAGEGDTRANIAYLNILQKEIVAIQSLFDSEFGQLGEATLSVMHGWMPNCRLFVDQETQNFLSIQIYGLPGSDGSRPWTWYPVSITLFDMLKEGIIGPNWQSSPLISAIKTCQEMATNFDLHVQVDRDIRAAFPMIGLPSNLLEDLYFMRRSETGRVNQSETLYGYVSLTSRSDEFISSLRSGANEIIENMPIPETDYETRMMSSDFQKEAIQKAFEPDILLDPDPYEEGMGKIKYFDRTEYTFENLPPSKASEEYQLTVLSLESQALEKVLNYYNKPLIWFLNDNSSAVKTQYFSYPWPPEEGSGRLVPEGTSSKHDGTYTSTENWVLTVDSNLQDETSRNAARRYSHLENFNHNKPLIKFEGFRSPSLRPSDVYRAEFTINKKKFDLIRDGYTPGVQENEEEVIPDQTPQEKLEALSSEISQFHCADGGDPMSDEEVRRRYEEYKMFASQRKKEIVRELRAKVIEAYANQEEQHSISIKGNLGPFGPIDISDESFTAYDAIGAVAPIAEYFADSEGGLLGAWSDLDPFGQRITPDSGPRRFEWNSIKVGIPAASKMMRNFSSDVNETEFESNKKVIDLNLSQEAANLDAVFGELDQLFKNAAPHVEKESQKQFLAAGFANNPDIDLEDDFEFEFVDVVAEKPGSKTVEGRKISKITYHTSFRAGSTPYTAGALGLGRRDSRGSIDGMSLNSAVLEKAKMSELSSLSNPRTMGYFEQLEDIAGIGGAGSTGAFVDPLKSTCADIFSSKPGIAFAMRYTYPKVTVKKPKDKPDPVVEWAKSQFADPFMDWMDESGENLSSSWSEWKGESADYSKAEILPMIGEACTLEQIYKEFVDKYNIFSLLCDWLKCLRLPGFSLQGPNFHLPPIPKLPTFGWMQFLSGQIRDTIAQVLRRALCSFVRGLMEILTVPWCQENLQDQMFGPSNLPLNYQQQALTDALTDLGIPKSEYPAAADMVADVSQVLTPRELCFLLEGNDLPSEVYHVIQNLIKAKEYGSDPKEFLDSLDSAPKIKYFFESVGVYMDSDLCEALKQYDQILGEYTCKNAADMLTQIRNRLENSSATPEQIEEALALAEKNMMDKSKAFEIMANSSDMSAIVPAGYKPGDPAAVISEMPESLKYSSTEAARAVFEPAKMAYVSSLKGYVPALSINTPSLVEPCMPGYNERATIIIEQNLERLRYYAEAVGETNSISPDDSSLAASKRRPISTMEDGTAQLSRDELAASGVTSWISLLHKLSSEFDKGQITCANGETFSVHEKERTSGTEQQSWRLIRSSSSVWNNDQRRALQCGDIKLVRSIDIGPMDEKFEIKSINSELITTVSTYEQLTKIVLRCNEYIDARYDPPLPWNKPDGFPSRDELENKISDIRSNLKLSFFNKSNEMLQDIQREIDANINEATKTTQTSTLLAAFKDVYDQSLESLREYDSTNGFNSREVTSFEPSGAAMYDTFNINLQIESSLGFTPYVKMKEFKGRIDKDPYIIEVGNSPLIAGSSQTPVKFEFCDTVPESYVDDIRAEYGEAGNIFAKRAVFYSAWKRSIEKMLMRSGEAGSVPNFDRIFLGNESGEGYTMYQKTFEGVVEQIMGRVNDSRYFNQNYVDELKSRVEGKSFYDPISECIRNKFNLSHFGLLSFDQMVTENYPEELTKELARPENSPEFTDYTQPGPTEKAMINVALRGFIRVCLIELMLKGGIVYSVWDMESVASNSYYKKYLTEVIHSEINKRNSFTKNDIILLDSLRKLAGDRDGDQRNLISKIVDIEIMRMPDLSKKIFENRQPIDYSEYHLTSIPHKYVANDFRVTPGSRMWVYNMADAQRASTADTSISYNDPFLITESYVRLEAINPELPHLANLSSIANTFTIEQLKEALETPNLKGLYNNITSGLAWPNIEDYNIEELLFSDSMLGGLDQDNNLSSEVFHHDELHGIIVSILVPPYSGDYRRFIYDAKGLLYYPLIDAPIGSPASVRPGPENFHPADATPKALQIQPARFIKRKRKKYIVSGQIFDPMNSSTALLKRYEIFNIDSGIGNFNQNVNDDQLNLNTEISSAFSEYYLNPGLDIEGDNYEYQIVPVDGAALREFRDGFIGAPTETNYDPSVFDFYKNQNIDFITEHFSEFSHLSRPQKPSTIDQYRNIFGLEFEKPWTDGPKVGENGEFIASKKESVTGLKMSTLTFSERIYNPETKKTDTLIMSSKYRPLDPDAFWNLENKYQVHDGTGPQPNVGVLGRVSEDIFNAALNQKLDILNIDSTPAAEEWLETVFDFKDNSSVIYDFVGETYDPLIVNPNPLMSNNSISSVIKEMPKPYHLASNSLNFENDGTYMGSWEGSFEPSDDLTRMVGESMTLFVQGQTRFSAYLTENERVSIALPYSGEFGCFNFGFKTRFDGDHEPNMHNFGKFSPTQPMGYQKSPNSPRGWLHGRAKISELPTSQGIDGRPIYELKATDYKEMGYNQYSIPTRILITQIRHGIAPVDQCYVKYVLPQSVTFDHYNVEDDPSKIIEIPNAEFRNRLMNRAIVEIMEEYIEDVEEAFQILLNYRSILGASFDDNEHWPTTEEMEGYNNLSKVMILRKFCPKFPMFLVQENMDRFSYTVIPGEGEQGLRFISTFLKNDPRYRKYVDWRLLDSYYNDPNRGASRIVSIGQNDFKRKLNDQSAGDITPQLYGGDASSNPRNVFNRNRLAYCSTAKIYSKMCEIEAREGIGNFDDNKLNKLFGADPGILLKKKNTGRNRLSYNTAIRERNADPRSVSGIPGKFRNGNYGNDDRYLQSELQGIASDFVTSQMIGVWDTIMSSTTGLYNYNAHDFMNRNKERKHETALAINNLLLWFKQRRADSFWGRTFNFTQYRKQKAVLNQEDQFIKQIREANGVRETQIKTGEGATSGDLTQVNNYDDARGRAAETLQGLDIIKPDINLTPMVRGSHPVSGGGFGGYIPIQTDLPNPGIICGSSPFLSDGRYSSLELYNSINNLVKGTLEGGLLKKTKSSLRSQGGADALSPASQKKIVSSLSSLMFMTTCDLGLGKLRYGQGYAPGISRQLEQAVSSNHHGPYNAYGSRADGDVRLLQFMQQVLENYFKISAYGELIDYLGDLRDKRGREYIVNSNPNEMSSPEYWRAAIKIVELFHKYAMSDMTKAESDLNFQKVRVPIYRPFTDYVRLQNDARPPSDAERRYGRDVWLLLYSEGFRAGDIVPTGTDEVAGTDTVAGRLSRIPEWVDTGETQLVDSGVAHMAPSAGVLAKQEINPYDLAAEDQFSYFNSRSGRFAQKRLSTRSQLKSWLIGQERGAVNVRLQYESDGYTINKQNIVSEQNIRGDVTGVDEKYSRKYIFSGAISTQELNLNEHYDLSVCAFSQNHLSDWKLRCHAEYLKQTAASQGDNNNRVVKSIDNFKNYFSFIGEDLIKTGAFRAFKYLRYGNTEDVDGYQISSAFLFPPDEDGPQAGTRIAPALQAETISVSGNDIIVSYEDESLHTWEGTVNIQELRDSYMIPGPNTVNTQAWVAWYLSNSSFLGKNYKTEFNRIAGRPFKFDNVRWASHSLYGRGQGAGTKKLLPDTYDLNKYPIFNRDARNNTDALLINLPFIVGSNILNLIYGSSPGQIHTFLSPCDFKYFHSSDLSDVIEFSSRGDRDDSALTTLSVEIELATELESGTTTGPSARVNIVPQAPGHMPIIPLESHMFTNGYKDGATETSPEDRMIYFHAHDPTGGHFKQATKKEVERICYMINNYGPIYKNKHMTWLANYGITSGFDNANRDYEASQQASLGEVFDNTRIKFASRLCHVTPVLLLGNQDPYKETRFPDALRSDLGNYLTRPFTAFARASFDERAGRQIAVSPRSLQEELSIIPLAEYEEIIEVGDCLGFLEIKDHFIDSQNYLLTRLHDTEDFKTIVEYVFPLQRYMAAVTTFSTDALAAYNTMPTVFSSAKASLSAVFNIMSNRNDFGKNGAMDNFGGQNFSNSELFNQMMNNMDSKGPKLQCFDVPGFPEDFLEMLEEMIKDFIKYFPSMILRGIADNVDPAYQEMKHHYFACELQNFSFWDGNMFDFNTEGPWLSESKKDKTLKMGLTKRHEEGKANYVPVNIAFPIDLVGGILAPLPRSWGGDADKGKALGRTLEKFITYIYSGNLPFFDPNMAFAIPCIDSKSETDWGKYEFGQYGRYGHSFTPFTLMSMCTLNLPGDAERKKAICVDDEILEIEIEECED